MKLLPVKSLPEGDQWLYELKLDGFRGLAVKDSQGVCIWSRNRNDIGKRFPRLIDAFAAKQIPSGIYDGEIVCLDLNGKPSFESLQNFSSPQGHFLCFYAFDVLNLAGRSLARLPLTQRREILDHVLGSAGDHIRISPLLDASPDDIISAVRAQKLEGIVAKKKQSLYESGKRSGSWVKFKLLQEATFLVGGYLASGSGFESIVVGTAHGPQLSYAGKVEVYLKQRDQTEAVKLLNQLRVKECPFPHIPYRRAGDTWSAGLTKEEREQFVWLQPELKARVKFLELTSAGYMRHAQFVGFEG